jgi:hypothetical protein
MTPHFARVERGPTKPQEQEHPMTGRSARKDSLGFTMIYAATFAIFFAVAIIDRLVPVRWFLGAAKSENYMAIFAEAKSAAATYTPFAFMG